MSDYISTAEAAIIIGVQDSRVRQLLRAGSLAGKRFGRDWLVERAAAEQFVRTPRGPVPGEPRQKPVKMRKRPRNQVSRQR